MEVGWAGPNTTALAYGPLIYGPFQARRGVITQTTLLEHGF
jgi:hypothetical protein